MTFKYHISTILSGKLHIYKYLAEYVYLCIFRNDFKLRIAHFRLAIISSNGYCVLDTEHRIKEKEMG